MTPPKKYFDLGDLQENARIKLIGHRVVDHREVVGFIVESNKAESYIKQLRELYPGVAVIKRSPGPLPEMETVIVGPVGAAA